MDGLTHFDPFVTREWIAALRSGNYVRATRQLKEDYDHAPSRFCCLGVLCDVVNPDGWEGQYYYNDYDSFDMYAPADMLGFDEDIATVYAAKTHKANTSRTFNLPWQVPAVWNDDMNYSFAEIADALEVWIP